MIGQCLRTARKISAGEKEVSGSPGAAGICDGVMDSLLSAGDGETRNRQLSFGAFLNGEEGTSERQQRAVQLVDQDLEQDINLWRGIFDIAAPADAQAGDRARLGPDG